MDDTTTWSPSKDEVAHIREELRPIIDEIARRDEQTLAAERWRREHVLV
jgi:hypothetical protein